MDISSAMASRKNVAGLLIGIVLVGTVLLGAWLLMNKLLTQTSDTGGVKAVVVMYDSGGFSPSEVTVKQGGTVTFLQNNAEYEMWVASDDHLEHADYSGTPMEEHCPDVSGLKFDQCGSGVSYSFTFQKTGAWGYHNHENPEAKGTITVTQ
jgi:plastocyanin